MPAVRLSMRKTREVLRLKYNRGLSNREIAHACSIARSTVGDYLERARKAGLTWPVDLDDEELDRLLFIKKELHPGTTRSIPDWAEVQKELKRKGVTLSLLWQEYKINHPDGSSTANFANSTESGLGRSML